MDKRIICRLERWMEGEIAPPLRVEIWPTYRCNLQCRFCRDSESKFPVETAKNHLPKVLKACGKFGVEECFIGGGGEPLVEKRLTFQLMTMAKDMKMWGFLNTNGTLFEEKDVKKIVEMGWDEIAFSLHGIGDVHDRLVSVKYSFEKVAKTINLFRKIKRHTNSDIPKIDLWFVITRENYFQIPEILRFAHENECNNLFFFSVREEVKGARELKMGEKEIQELKEIVEEMKEFVKEYGIHTNLEKFSQEECVKHSDEINRILLSRVEEKNDFLNIPCYEPWYYMTITPDGKIGPCAALTHLSPLRIENVEIEEAWKSEFFQKIREKLLRHEISDICKKCCIDKAFESERIREELRKVMWSG